MREHGSSRHRLSFKILSMLCGGGTGRMVSREMYNGTSTSILFAALSKIPYTVHRGEMNANTWNDLKGKIMAVHGPNIDWWDVRIAVNEVLTRKFHLPVGSPEEAFNIAYEVKPLPYRKNNPDG